MYRIVRTIGVLAVVALMSLSALVSAVSADSSARPFTGSMVGIGIVMPDETCATGLRTVVSFTGTASHLGRVSMTGSHCAPDWGAPIVGGEWTFVAANGDTLVGTYTGTIDPFVPEEGAVMVGRHDNTITGGSGRFAGATGEFLVSYTGILHFAEPMTLSSTWVGTLGY
jgi:hypothetical protein